MANDLILVEMIVGNTFCFCSPFPFGLNFSNVWEAFFVTILSHMALGVLMARSGKDFFDRPLNVLFAGPGPVNSSQKSLDPLPYVLLWSRNGSSCCSSQI